MTDGYIKLILLLVTIIFKTLYFRQVLLVYSNKWRTEAGSHIELAGHTDISDWYGATIPNLRLVWRRRYLPYRFQRYWMTLCHELCKNGWTDRDAVWVVDSGGSKKACIRWGAHWRHLANTIEPSMCGGDAVYCQITLTTCCNIFSLTFTGQAVAHLLMPRIRLILIYSKLFESRNKC